MAEQKARYRNWSFIFYPESAPENWRQLAAELEVELGVSPLHDKDVNETTGELKKPHYHAVIAYEGKKSYEQVKADIKAFNGPEPKVCKSIKGSVQYFDHRNNPEKAQYDMRDAAFFGGMDVEEILKPTKTERLHMQKEMLDFIDERGLVEFSQFTRICRQEGLDDWLDILLNYSTMAFRTELDSRRNSYIAKEKKDTHQ
jgi:hypothetical protein